MFKKISLILAFCMFFGFSAFAEDPEIPAILTDPENGPFVWVSADTGIETIDGQRVWRDLSGNENHMTVYGSPQVKQRAINQRPAMIVSRGSSDQYFSVSFDEEYVGDATIFIVANMKNYEEYKTLFSTDSVNRKRSLNTFRAYFLNNQIEAGSYNQNSEDINKDYLFSASDGAVFGKYHNFILTESGNYTDGVWSSTNMQTYYGVYDKNNDTTTLTRMVNTNDKNKGNTLGLYNTFTGFTLGNGWDYNGSSPEGEYAEAIMFKRALSQEEILEVSEYLSEKYFKPFPPTDGIEFNMNAEKDINGDTAELKVSLEQIEGSVFNDEFFVVAQLYEDEAMTMPKDIIVKKSTDDLTFNYNQALFAKIMAFSAYGAEDTSNIGIPIAHPIVR